jgi:hypothetical protein
MDSALPFSTFSMFFPPIFYHPFFSFILFFDEALSIGTELFGNNHPNVAQSLHNLGTFFSTNFLSSLPFFYPFTLFLFLWIFALTLSTFSHVFFLSITVLSSLLYIHFFSFFASYSGSNHISNVAHSPHDFLSSLLSSCLIFLPLFLSHSLWFFLSLPIWFFVTLALLSICRSAVPASGAMGRSARLLRARARDTRGTLRAQSRGHRCLVSLASFFYFSPACFLQH